MGHISHGRHNRVQGAGSSGGSRESPNRCLHERPFAQGRGAARSTPVNTKGKQIIVTSKSLLLAGAAGLLTLSAPAVAQTVQSPTPPAVDAATATPDEDGLQEITVTAERRSENLQRVPVSVAVVV